MKTSLALAGLVLALGGLVGCSGDDDGGDNGGTNDSGGIPSNASTEDFCGIFEALAKDLGSFTPDSDPADAIQSLQDAAADMRETGVPENATDDQRAGLEVTLDAIDTLDDDASLEDISGLEEGLSEADQEKADAFDDYLKEECGELG